ncbi:hypothetical protein ACFVWP_42915 [Streptomyces sp. NPDC058175]|uniref:hypothetical protein n=1 Tax=Streptomyces sp. NPDC058175 TaxID=3346367 RepID=UPI0036EE2565
MRREALAHALIMNEAHARQVLAAYAPHDNEHRPHRARNQLPPGAHQQPAPLQEEHHSRAHHAGADSAFSPAVPRGAAPTVRAPPAVRDR